MSCSVKSSTLESPKPVNIFYIWYGELCRRLNMQPLSIVKPAKPKNDAVLDFVGDRIKADEWSPILNALRQDTSLHVIGIRSRVQCKFLDDIDTERKCREMKRRGGSLYTAYILKNLLAVLNYSIKRSQVLTCLELDGLPITAEYLGPLLEALSKNKTIKILSLKHCPIRDYGCQQLCLRLRYISNIEVLNLTACGLGSLSAQYIAKVIRYQQINRYCESWHCSLRYEDPDIGMMTGLKRITLNNNPNIGDEGLSHILNELDDDLWIKAIDMQKCNITESMSSRLIDIIDYSKSLEVADFRHNDQLCTSTIEKILSILRTKQRFGYETEFQWCLTATSIPYENSINDMHSYTSSMEPRSVQKCKSAPLKQITKRSSASSVPIRRIRTFTMFSKPNRQQSRNVNLGRNNNLGMKLNTELQQEISKHKQTEQEKKGLQIRLETTSSHNIENCESKEKNVKFDPSSTIRNELTRTKETLNITLPTAACLNKQDSRIKKVSALQNSIQTESKLYDSKESYVVKTIAGPKSKSDKVEFVFTTADDKEKNAAQTLFENIMYRSGSDDSNDAEEDLFSYFDGQSEEPEKTVCAVDDEDELGNSNVSLLRFVEEIKSGNGSLDCGMQNNSATNWTPNSGQRHLAGFQKVIAKVPPVS